MTETTRALVTEMYDAYEAGDLNRIAAVLHDDIDWIIYAPIQVFPFAGHWRGKTAVVEAMRQIRDSYRINNYRRLLLLADGERAALLADGSFVDIESQRVLRLLFGNQLVFKDGRLIEFREFLDSFNAVEQALGVELNVL